MSARRIVARFKAADYPGPVNFTLTRAREPMGDALSPADHARERARFPDAREGWEARSNCRAIAYWGETQHEAVRAMINDLLDLVAKGSMDPSDPHRPMRNIEDTMASAALQIATRYESDKFVQLDHDRMIAQHHARQAGKYMPEDDEDQDRLGRLYAELSRVLKGPKSGVEREMSRLVAKYGPENVKWTLGVLKDDLR